MDHGPSQSACLPWKLGRRPNPKWNKIACRDIRLWAGSRNWYTHSALEGRRISFGAVRNSKSLGRERLQVFRPVFEENLNDFELKQKISILLFLFSLQRETTPSLSLEERNYRSLRRWINKVTYFTEKRNKGRNELGKNSRKRNLTFFAATFFLSIVQFVQENIQS